MIINSYPLLILEKSFPIINASDLTNFEITGNYICGTQKIRRKVLFCGNWQMCATVRLWKTKFISTPTL
jgi:hypothetical protein